LSDQPEPARDAASLVKPIANSGPEPRGRYLRRKAAEFDPASRQRLLADLEDGCRAASFLEAEEVAEALRLEEAHAALIVRENRGGDALRRSLMRLVCLADRRDELAGR
jgi:hypothetical protein